MFPNLEFIYVVILFPRRSHLFKGPRELFPQVSRWKMGGMAIAEVIYDGEIVSGVDVVFSDRNVANIAMADVGFDVSKSS